MLQVLIVTVAVVLAIVATFLVPGPNRVWGVFGKPGLGPVDFETLSRRSSPNDALACPPGLCKAAGDLTPPLFAINASDLREAMIKALASEPRLSLVHSDPTTLTDSYVQRSALMGFPDTIVVRFINQPEGRSTLAIYSRSQIGYGDMGVNRARIERWLAELKRQVSIPPGD